MPHINWSNFGGTFNYMNYGGAITGFSTDANELLLLDGDGDEDEMVWV